MCGPVIPILATAAAAATIKPAKKALKDLGASLKPKIDLPSPIGPGENIAAAAQNAAQSERRRALLSRGQRSTILTGYGGAQSSPQQKTLLGS